MNEEIELLKSVAIEQWDDIFAQWEETELTEEYWYERHNQEPPNDWGDTPLFNQ